MMLVARAAVAIVLAMKHIAPARRCTTRVAHGGFQTCLQQRRLLTLAIRKHAAVVVDAVPVVQICGRRVRVQLGRFKVCKLRLTRCRRCGQRHLQAGATAATPQHLRLLCALGVPGVARGPGAHA